MSSVECISGLPLKEISTKSPMVIHNDDSSRYSSINLLSLIEKEKTQVFSNNKCHFVLKNSKVLNQVYHIDKEKISHLFKLLFQYIFSRINSGFVIVYPRQIESGIEFIVKDTGRGMSNEESKEFLMHSDFAKSVIAMSGNLMVLSDPEIGTHYEFSFDLEKSDEPEANEKITFNHIADWFGDDVDQLKNFVEMAVNCVIDELATLRNNTPETEAEIKEIYHRIKPHLTTLDLENYYSELPRPSHEDYNSKLTTSVDYLQNRMDKILNHIQTL